MNSAAVCVEVQYISSADNLPVQADFDRWVQAALCEIGGPTEVTIRIVDEPESAQLNSKYRDKEGSTNVLSFPADVPVEVSSPLLGDLVICAQLVRSEAQQQNKTELSHWAHLVVHGVLHLLGYDHQCLEQARKMERHELEVLQRLGFSDPYLMDGKP